MISRPEGYPDHVSDADAATEREVLVRTLLHLILLQSSLGEGDLGEAKHWAGETIDMLSRHPQFSAFEAELTARLEELHTEALTSRT